MKAYKIELLIIDFDGIGSDGISEEILNARYANDCIDPQIKKITESDIGEWHDGHPLNLKSQSTEEYKKLFP